MSNEIMIRMEQIVKTYYIGPVSYTHLDVYKRQVKDYENSLFDLK